MIYSLIGGKKLSLQQKKSIFKSQPSILNFPARCISENCIKMKTNLNFIFKLLLCGASKTKRKNKQTKKNLMYSIDSWEKLRDVYLHYTSINIFAESFFFLALAKACYY